MKRGIRVLGYWVAILLAVSLLGFANNQHADAAWQQPVGGCAEAYTAPHSVGADECRDAGWTIRVRRSGHGIIVSPRHVVRYLWLPQCKWEDGGENQPCTWNMTLPYQGNGKGRAYWIDREDRVHFVKRTLA